MEGDYGRFALVVSRRRTGSQTVLRISLLGEPPPGGGRRPPPRPHPRPAPESRDAHCAPGRNWYLPSGTMEKFVCLAKRQGLSKNNVVFPDLTGNGVPGTQGRGPGRGRRPPGSPVGGGRPQVPVLRPHAEPVWRAPWPLGVGLGLGLGLGPPPCSPGVPGSRTGEPRLWTLPRAPVLPSRVTNMTSPRASRRSTPVRGTSGPGRGP